MFVENAKLQSAISTIYTRQSLVPYPIRWVKIPWVKIPLTYRPRFLYFLSQKGILINQYCATVGEYEEYKPIYQEYAELPVDDLGRQCQAGVFFSYEACGLGFRRETGIINNQSQFVGHYVEVDG